MVGKLWNNYNASKAYDGYFTNENKLRKHAVIISSILEKYGKEKLQEIEKNCQSTISARGINFRVYAANNRAEEKKWPLDIIPRIIPKSQWNKVTKGLKQRVKALNLFIDDAYNQKKIFKDKQIINKDIFSSNKDGAYYYSSGWHIKSIYSLFIGFIFASATIWNPEFRFLQPFSWIIGAFFSSITYYLLARK